jgi:hypothetical protein
MLQAVAGLGAFRGKTLSVAYTTVGFLSSRSEGSPSYHLRTGPKSHRAVLDLRKATAPVGLYERSSYNVRLLHASTAGWRHGTGSAPSWGATQTTPEESEKRGHGPAGRECRRAIQRVATSRSSARSRGTESGFSRTASTCSARARSRVSGERYPLTRIARVSGCDSRT